MKSSVLFASKKKIINCLNLFIHTYLMAIFQKLIHLHHSLLIILDTYLMAIFQKLIHLHHSLLIILDFIFNWSLLARTPRRQFRLLSFNQEEELFLCQRHLYCAATRYCTRQIRSCFPLGKRWRRRPWCGSNTFFVAAFTVAELLLALLLFWNMRHHKLQVWSPL